MQNARRGHLQRTKARQGEAMKAIPGTVSEYIPQAQALAGIIGEIHTPVTHEQNVIVAARRVVEAWGTSALSLRLATHGAHTFKPFMAALGELAAALKEIDVAPSEQGKDKT